MESIPVNQANGGQDLALVVCSACGRQASHTTWCVSGGESFACCRSHVLAGNTPADWHRECMKTRDELTEALRGTGFEKCEFGQDSDPCEKCGTKNEQLYFGNRDYWDGREGTYWCAACVIKLHEENCGQEDIENRRGVMLGKFYEVVCVGVASVSSYDGGPQQQVIGLSFPLPEPVLPDDLDHEDNFEDVFIPVAAAKSLLVDLRDAVESIVERRPFA